MKPALYFCGGGNAEGVRLAQAVQRRRPRWDRMTLLDDDPGKLGSRQLGVEVLGGFGLLAGAESGATEVVNLVARTTDRRRRAGDIIASFGHPFAELVHPDVDVRGAELGLGLTVYHHASIAPRACIGAGSVLFMGATVSRDCQVGPGCVLASGSALGPEVRLAAGVYVGTKAVVEPGVCIGAGATIGASSLVVADVPAGATVVGVPGQVLLPQATPAAADAAPPGAADALVAELRQVIAGAWASILGLGRVDPGDNFFDVGGNSLLALQVLEHLRTAIRGQLSPTDLFRFPTVAALAEHLGRQTSAHASREQRERRAARRRGFRRRQRRRRRGPELDSVR